MITLQKDEHPINLALFYRVDWSDFTSVCVWLFQVLLTGFGNPTHIAVLEETTLRESIRSGMYEIEIDPDSADFLQGLVGVFGIAGGAFVNNPYDHTPILRTLSYCYHYVWARIRGRVPVFSATLKPGTFAHRDIYYQLPGEDPTKTKYWVYNPPLSCSTIVTACMPQEHRHPLDFLPAILYTKFKQIAED